MEPSVEYKVKLDVVTAPIYTTLHQLTFELVQPWFGYFWFISGSWCALSTKSALYNPTQYDSTMQEVNQFHWLIYALANIWGFPNLLL